MKATADQRFQYGEWMSLWGMLPSHPLPTVPFPSGFLDHHLKKQDRPEYNEVVGFSCPWYPPPQQDR